MEIRDFGCVEGRQVKLYIIENTNGMKVAVMNYGATVVSIEVPDKNGVMTDVALGYDSVEEYEANNSCFGATVGRNANRIHNGRFMLEDTLYQLDQNDHENNLHSGFHGFQHMLWNAIYSEDSSEVSFWHESAPEEQGFPGSFYVKVTFRLTEDNELVIFYDGHSDRKTIANMTNHTYFNLAGHSTGNAMKQRVQIPSTRYTPVADSHAIPTGEIAEVHGTPFDFRQMKEICRDIDADFSQLTYVGGYDHNFVVEETGKKVRLAAKAESLETGITLAVYTDCPGVQFYTGNGIGHQQGKGGAVYENRHGYCFEPQYFPDAINQENFKSPILDSHEKYQSTSIYAFGLLEA